MTQNLIQIQPFNTPKIYGDMIAIDVIAFSLNYVTLLRKKNPWIRKKDARKTKKGTTITQLFKKNSAHYL